MKVIAVFLLCLGRCIVGFPGAPNEGIPLKLLRQEYIPSIEYKYVIKTILPTEQRWWKRGTHHLYAEEQPPKIIEAK
ncbi:hypothetical protein JTB14_008740 [Gonioctena quinquepunctata]|nr:hypothetical protein JTB14_008740 [Gonioctena quinquepunctata]